MPLQGSETGGDKKKESQEPTASQPLTAGTELVAGAASEQKPGEGSELRTLSVRVVYELQQPDTGLSFSGSYAHTGNQVRTLSAMFKQP